MTASRLPPDPWDDLPERLRTWGAKKLVTHPEPAEVETLLRRARARLASRQAPRRVRWLALGSASLAAAAAVVLWVARPLITGGTAWSAPRDRERVVRIEGATLTMNPGSRLRVETAQLPAREVRLDAGTVGFDVAPLRTGETFEVVAGSYRIRVVGTQFTVDLADRDEGEVQVYRGVVDMSGPRHARLHAGETARWRGESLTLVSSAVGTNAPAMDSPPRDGPETPAVPAQADADEDRGVRHTPAARQATPTFGALRALVLNGEYARAEQGLASHVVRSPRDAEAWLLLGDCRRKLRRYESSIEAYERAAAVGRSQEANRARFVAATVWQDDLGNGTKAIPLFERFLDSAARSEPLRAAAMLRLARAHRDGGDRATARTFARRVIAEFPGSPEALRAYAIDESLR